MRAQKLTALSPQHNAHRNRIQPVSEKTMDGAVTYDAEVISFTMNLSEDEDLLRG